MFNQNLSQSPRILAIANQKGGVGKTTTAINLGTALAAVGETVLIVDLDPQGNASTGLGIVRGPKQKSSYHVLIGEAELDQVIVDSGIPRLHCVPSTIDLLGAELELADFDRKAYRLADAIARLSRQQNKGAQLQLYSGGLPAVAQSSDDQFPLGGGRHTGTPAM